MKTKPLTFLLALTFLLKRPLLFLKRH